MEARHLRYAVALAEHAHFGRAATALGIAQPPLSKQIAALEREVGARLFDRTRRGVFPTAAGAAFLVRARAALAEIGAASVDAARAARGESGRLRLGFIASALLDPLPGVLRRFSRERPGVRLELHEMASSRSSAALAGGSWTWPSPSAGRAESAPNAWCRSRSATTTWSPWWAPAIRTRDCGRWRWPNCSTSR